MKLAFAFAGQGAEQPRMGVAMAEAHPAARRLLDAAGADVVDALHRGRAIERTSRVQPAMVAVGLGAFGALREHGLHPDVTLGHSLGELSAWAASGAVEPLDAVRLARLRGEAMELAAAARPGGMLALQTSELAVVAAALEASRDVGAISVAAQNAPDAWVLSGDDGALRAAARVAPGTRLAVGGPWHATSMAAAVPAFHDALASVVRRPPSVLLVANATGELADPEAMPRLLARQLVRPVKWARSMRTLAQLGVTDLVVCGPGKALRQLARQIPNLRAHACEDPRDVQRLAAELCR